MGRWRMTRARRRVRPGCLEGCFGGCCLLGNGEEARDQSRRVS